MERYGYKARAQNATALQPAAVASEDLLGRTPRRIFRTMHRGRSTRGRRYGRTPSGLDGHRSASVGPGRADEGRGVGWSRSIERYGADNLLRRPMSTLG